MPIYTGKTEDPLAAGTEIMVRGAPFIVAQVCLAKRRELRAQIRGYITAGQALARQPGESADASRDVLLLDEQMETLADTAVDLARAGFAVNYPDVDRVWVENNLSRDQVLQAANIALGFAAPETRASVPSPGAVPLARAPNGPLTSATTS